MKLAIIGAAELGRLITQHASKSGYQVVGYYDDYTEKKEFDGLPVFGSSAAITKDFENGLFDCLMVGIGYNHMNARADMFQRFHGKIPFANVIHPSAYVDDSVKLGTGNFFLPGVVIDCGVAIGNNVLLNTGVIIAHDSALESHSFLAPGVTVAGLVTIHEKCFIGIGAIIRDCISIGENCIIGAGSLVLKDTAPGSINMGFPAKAAGNKKL